MATKWPCCLLWKVVSIKGCPQSMVVFPQRSIFPLNVVFWIKAVFHQRFSSNRCHIPSKLFFQKRSTSIKGFLSSKVIFHQKFFSLKGFFHQWLSSTKVPLPSELLFPQLLSFIKGCLQPKVVFHQKLFPIRGWYVISMFIEVEQMSLGQILSGQLLLGQMSLWELSINKDDPIKLPIKLV